MSTIMEHSAAIDRPSELSELERFAGLARSLVPMTSNEIERQCIRIKRAIVLDVSSTVVYKIQRNRHHSKFYMIKKSLSREQPDTFHIEDSDLGVVTSSLSYVDAEVCCDQLNREHVRNLNHLGRLHSRLCENKI